SHILSCTTSRLDVLMGATRAPDNVFHYLPFCFAASWITMLSCLSRNSILHLAMDLTRLADDLRAVDPDYCVNVPAVLERMRTAVEQHIAKRGGFIEKTFVKAKAAALPGNNGHSGSAFSLTVARALI